MKAPVDPSEPLFPVRPNEPVCQYYMKHGTCKFGQACKFHHPPQSTVTAALVGGGAVVMNMGRKSDAPQIVMNSMSGDGSGGTPMMLQFLPQRPDEQDCIFFLKNGRCKYGATCRYHHPISFSGQRRPDDGRRRVQVQQVPEGYLHFINQSGSNHYQQGPSSSSGGTHMVVADGPVTYMTVDSGKGSYHQLSVVSNDGYCAPTGAPISQNQDHTSSTSSIASSYDTATSNLDHLVSHNEQQSSGLWNRQKNNGSHASLNAYDNSGARARMPMPQSTSDGSIASRRHRAASYGSASDGGAFVDANGNVTGRPGPHGGGGAQMPNNASSGHVPTWRTERTPSYENVRRGVSNQYQEQQQGPRGPRRPPGGRGRPNEVDDGLSMMTSALLTMLDTPEEAAAEGYEYDYEEMDQHACMQVPPHQMPMMHQNMAHGQRPPGVARAPSNGQAYRLDDTDRDFMGGMVMNSPTIDGRYQDPHHINAEESSHWLPNWETPKSVGRSLEGDAQSMSVIQPRHATPNSPQPSSNVGLFLP